MSMTALEQARAAIREGLTLALTPETVVPAPEKKTAPVKAPVKRLTGGDLAAAVSLALRDGYNAQLTVPDGQPCGEVNIWAEVEPGSRWGRALGCNGFFRQPAAGGMRMTVWAQQPGLERKQERGRHITEALGNLAGSEVRFYMVSSHA